MKVQIGSSACKNFKPSDLFCRHFGPCREYSELFRSLRQRRAGVVTSQFERNYQGTPAAVRWVKERWTSTLGKMRQCRRSLPCI